MIFGFLRVRIIKRPDQLIIQDGRPTLPMLLSILGAISFSVIFALRFFFGDGVGVDSFGMWAIGAFAVIFVGLSFIGTIGEEYIFDRPSDSYQFTRRHVYKKDVIKGTISKFRGVGVRTDVIDDKTRHAVVLRQDGLLFGASPEQPLREVKPALNFWSTEDRIAHAIHKFLNIPRVDSSD